MLVRVSSYDPIQIVDHHDGFYSAVLFRNPMPVSIFGTVYHMCDRIITETYRFDSKEKALEFFRDNFENAPKE